MADETVVSVDDLLEAGNRALDAGNYAAALDHWTRALEIEPDNARAAGLVSELQTLIADKQVENMTPVSGEFVVVMDDDIELEMEVVEPASDPCAGAANATGALARGALDQLQRVLVEHEAQGAALAEQLSTLERQLLEAKAQLRDHDAKQRQRDRQLAELEHALEAERAAVAAARSEGEAAVAAARAEVDAAVAAARSEGEAAVAAARSEGEEALLAARAEHAAAVASHATALAEQSAAQETLVSEHAAELERVQAQLQDAELERAAAVAEVEGLSDELAEMRNALASEHAEVEELRETKQRLASELDAASTQQREAEAQLAPMTARATAAEEAVVTRDARIRSLEQDVESLRSERDAAVAIGEAKEAAHASLESANAELAAAHASLESANAELAAANTALQSALDEAVGRADALDERVGELSQEIASLQRELTASGPSRPTAAQRPSLSPVLERAPAPTPLETRAITGTYESVSDTIEAPANPGDVEQEETFLELGDSGLELAGFDSGDDTDDDTDDDIELDDAALDALLAEDDIALDEDAGAASPPPAPPGPAAAQHTMIGHGLNLDELGELPSSPTPRDHSGASTPVEAPHAVMSDHEAQPEPTPTRSGAAHHLFDTSLSAMERLSWVLDEAPVLSTTELGPGQEIDSQAAFVLQLIDEGGVTFADVIDMVGLPAEDAAGILVDLLTRKILTTASLDA